MVSHHKFLFYLDTIYNEFSTKILVIGASTEEPTTEAMPICSNYGCNPGWYQASESVDEMRKCVSSWCCPESFCSENQTVFEKSFDPDSLSCLYSCTCKPEFWSIEFDEPQPGMINNILCVCEYFDGVFIFSIISNINICWNTS